MNLVIGRGRNRQVFAVPTGSVLARFTEAEQKGLIADMQYILRVTT